MKLTLLGMVATLGVLAAVVLIFLVVTSPAGGTLSQPN
jgi:hypothetical protein